MRIGELAALTGCTPKALRLYEAHGLLGTVARQGSYRHYGPEDVQRVQWIRQALALGFRLAALQPLRTMDTPAGAAAVLALLQTGGAPSLMNCSVCRPPTVRWPLWRWN